MTGATTDSPFFGNPELGQDADYRTRTGQARTVELVVYRDLAGQLVIELWDGALGQELSLVTFGVDKSANAVTSFSNIGLLLDNGAAGAGAFSIFNFDNVSVDTFATGVPEPTMTFTAAAIIVGASFRRRRRA